MFGGGGGDGVVIALIEDEDTWPGGVLLIVQYVLVRTSINKSHILYSIIMKINVQRETLYSLN